MRHITGDPLYYCTTVLLLTVVWPYGYKRLKKLIWIQTQLFADGQLFVHQSELELRPICLVSEVIGSLFPCRKVVQCSQHKMDQMVDFVQFP